MPDQPDEPQQHTEPGPSNAWRMRRRAVYVLGGFVIVSFFLHFTLGPTVAALSPSWRYPNMPEQTVTIFSVSKIVQPHPAPTPTPKPQPTPIIIKRAHMNLSLVQLREMVNGNALAHNKIRGANKKVDIDLRRLVKIRPHESASAPLAVTQPRPTLAPSRLASARADTGGASDRLAGSIEWGDDNPPTVLEQAAVAATTPTHQARIRVEVGPDGVVLSVTLLESSGDAQFDAAALDAARRSTYAPATLNGLPVHGAIVVAYPAAAGAT